MKSGKRRTRLEEGEDGEKTRILRQAVANLVTYSLKMQHDIAIHRAQSQSRATFDCCIWLLQAKP